MFFYLIYLQWLLIQQNRSRLKKLKENGAQWRFRFAPRECEEASLLQVSLFGRKLEV